jgi:hypothetical protein
MNTQNAKQRSRKYIVESYDNFDDPSQRRCRQHGEFDTVEAALGCARAIIDASIRATYKRGQSVGNWYSHWACFGVGVYLHGIDFDQFEYARSRIHLAIVSSRKTASG